MSHRLSACLVIAVFAAATTSAQEPAKPVTPADIQKDLEALKRKVEALEQQLKQAQADVAAARREAAAAREAAKKAASAPSTIFPPAFPTPPITFPSPFPPTPAPTWPPSNPFLYPGTFSWPAPPVDTKRTEDRRRLRLASAVSAAHRAILRGDTSAAQKALLAVPEEERGAAWKSFREALTSKGPEKLTVAPRQVME